jgi:WD40 repeat protein
VQKLDWSLDGCGIRSTCQNSELLFWQKKDTSYQARDENRSTQARQQHAWVQVGSKGANNSVGLALEELGEGWGGGDSSRGWATSTCTHGFGVMAVRGAVGGSEDDLNACDLSPDRRFVVSADDQGFLRLFHAPVVARGAMSRCYIGHASHVADVRWVSQDQLVTVGGHDMTICRWRLRQGDDKGEEGDEASRST